MPGWFLICQGRRNVLTRVQAVQKKAVKTTQDGSVTCTAVLRCGIKRALSRNQAAVPVFCACLRSLSRLRMVTAPRTSRPPAIVFGPGTSA